VPCGGSNGQYFRDALIHIETVDWKKGRFASSRACRYSVRPAELGQQPSAPGPDKRSHVPELRRFNGVGQT
jgi:hypothetical protein